MTMNRQPCFDNLLKVLRRKTPERPTLFEFFLNRGFYEKLAEAPFVYGDFDSEYEVVVKAFQNAGYDYATLKGSDFAFPSKSRGNGRTVSMNGAALVENRDDLEKIVWPDPEAFDYSRLERCRKALPDGMKIIVWGPGGVLENVTELTGYDNLCYILSEDPGLAELLFREAGTRLIRYYEICASFDTVGALISNDDWGFASQTLLSPKDLRRYVFPYHRKIVETIHAAGKPAILHSCGNLAEVMDDIIDDLKYDGKHSFEDKIQPVEDAYEQYHERIAILGGIDLDFICRSTPEAIEKRCREMIAQTHGCEGYALGTGNSVPDYVPYENYRAMIRAVRG